MSEACSEWVCKKSCMVKVKSARIIKFLKVLTLGKLTYLISTYFPFLMKHKISSNLLICKNCFDNRKLEEEEKSLSRAWNVPLKKLQCHLNPQFVRWWWFLFSFDFYELLTIKNLLTPCDEHESKLDLTPYKFKNDPL